jgi:hypothetical protein
VLSPFSIFSQPKYMFSSGEKTTRAIPAVHGSCNANPLGLIMFAQPSLHHVSCNAAGTTQEKMNDLSLSLKSELGVSAIC